MPPHNDLPGAPPASLLEPAWLAEREEEFAQHRNEGLEPGIVAVSYGNLGTVWTARGAQDFTVAGRLRLTDKHKRAGLPAVGDWVALRPPATHGEAWMVQQIMPRRTAFWRKMAGTAHKTQVVAANMDTIFVVTSLNRDFNARRLERYLSLAKESGARAVIVLSKADLAGEDEESMIDEAAALDPQTPVHAVSVVDDRGLAALDAYLQPGKMVALLGSSGVGKSTLINYWLGEERMRVNEIRNDERGRHTTSHRELLRLPNGALVIDTPGMREVTLMDHAQGLEEAFEDIIALAERCRFNDCRHENEPDCAVQAAIEADELDEDRLEHYNLLRAEVKQAEEKRVEMERKRQSQSKRKRR